MNSVDFSDVTFRYRRSGSNLIHSLELSLDTRPTLLLGRNGAGKSTLLKLAAGLLRPKSGRIVSNGTVSYLPQQFIKIPGLSCKEYASQLAWLAGKNRHKARIDAPQWLDKVGLSTLKSRSNTQLSGGQQARLALASALNSDNDFVLLDEPGAALDPLSKQDLHGLYSLVTKHGRGLVVSSHDPSDIHANFERVIIIDSGLVVYDNSLTHFTTSHDSHPLVAAFQSAMHTTGSDESSSNSEKGRNNGVANA